MKRSLFIMMFAIGFSLNGFSQTSPGNSAYGHSHKKYKRHGTYPVRRHRTTTRITPRHVGIFPPRPTDPVVSTTRSTKYKTHPARVTPVRTGNGHNKHN